MPRPMTGHPATKAAVAGTRTHARCAPSLAVSPASPNDLCLASTGGRAGVLRETAGVRTERPRAVSVTLKLLSERGQGAPQKNFATFP